MYKKKVHKEDTLCRFPRPSKFLTSSLIRIPFALNENARLYVVIDGGYYLNSYTKKNLFYFVFIHRMVKPFQVIKGIQNKKKM